MRKLLNCSIITLLLFLASSVFAAEAHAQVFKFQLANPSQSIKVNDTFAVKILINTAGKQVINGDALMTFDPVKVSIDSAATGNFFTYFSANPLGGSTTKYLVSSWEESVGNAKSASSDTLFATLSMTAKSQGTTSLTFDCTVGTESDSNINQASDSKDVIVCPLSPLSLTIGAASGPSTTPTAGPSSTPGPTATPTIKLTPSPSSTPSATPTKGPTNTPAPTNTPRPAISQLPRSGTTEVTMAVLGIGAVLTVVGLLIIL